LFYTYIKWNSNLEKLFPVPSCQKPQWSPFKKYVAFHLKLICIIFFCNYNYILFFSCISGIASWEVRIVSWTKTGTHFWTTPKYTYSTVDTRRSSINSKTCVIQSATNQCYTRTMPPIYVISGSSLNLGQLERNRRRADDQEVDFPMQ
jgi:hypothetical protein